MAGKFIKFSKSCCETTREVETIGVGVGVGVGIDLKPITHFFALEPDTDAPFLLAFPEPEMAE